LRSFPLNDHPHTPYATDWVPFSELDTWLSLLLLKSWLLISLAGGNGPFCRGWRSRIPLSFFFSHCRRALLRLSLSFLFFFFGVAMIVSIKASSPLSFSLLFWFFFLFPSNEWPPALINRRGLSEGPSNSGFFPPFFPLARFSSFFGLFCAKSHLCVFSLLSRGSTFPVFLYKAEKLSFPTVKGAKPYSSFSSGRAKMVRFLFFATVVTLIRLTRILFPPLSWREISYVFLLSLFLIEHSLRLHDRPPFFFFSLTKCSTFFTGGIRIVASPFFSAAVGLKVDLFPPLVGNPLLKGISRID